MTTGFSGSMCINSGVSMPPSISTDISLAFLAYLDCKHNIWTAPNTKGLHAQFDPKHHSKKHYMKKQKQTFRTTAGWNILDK